MNFIQNALRNIQTTLLGLAPLAIGGYLAYKGFKTGNVGQVLEGVTAISGGAGLVASKDGSKSGTAVVPK